MILLRIQNVIFRGCCFLYTVDTRLQAVNVDFAVLVCDTVEVVGAVLDPGDVEVDTSEVGTVRAGLMRRKVACLMLVISIVVVLFASSSTVRGMGSAT